MGRGYEMMWKHGIPERLDRNIYLYRYRADAHTLAAAGVDAEPERPGMLARLRAGVAAWWVQRFEGRMP